MTTNDTRPPAPLPTVGIIGAGQLARMTIQAAIPLAIPVRVLAASPDDSAAKVCADVTVGSPDDPDAVAAFAAGCDVVTFDHELVPPAVLDRLDAEGVNLAPSSATMRIAQDKHRQRELFATAGLPQPRFGIATSVDEALAHAEAIGLPVVVKAASGGYDGRGVWICDDRAEIERVAGQLVSRGIVVLVEEKVAIDREFSVLIGRSKREVAIYDPVRTIQVDGICREIVEDQNHFPDLRLQVEAREIGRKIAELTDVVGILAVELFESGDRWFINEIATRPHNSGHWSIEAADTSQFEQHLRAVTGRPLGSTRSFAPTTITVNVIGPADGSDPADRLDDALKVKNVHIHLYGKTARPGRKLGHVTVVGWTEEDCREPAWHAVKKLTGESRPREMR